MDPRDLRIAQLEAALKQLLDEVIAAGFESAEDYNWPKAIADARRALSGDEPSCDIAIGYRLDAVGGKLRPAVVRRDGETDQNYRSRIKHVADNDSKYRLDWAVTLHDT